MICPYVLIWPKQYITDDTTIFDKHTDLNELDQIVNSDLNVLQNWFTENKLCFNVNKIHFSGGRQIEESPLWY